MVHERLSLMHSRVPDEIRLEIIERLCRPQDLMNLCLTCHGLRDLAVDALYKKVTLGLSTLKSMPKINAFLHPHNGPQLARIRNLTIQDDIPSPLTDDQVSHAKFVARLIIDALPEDSLRSFSWNTCEKFSADSLMALYRRQKKLQTIWCDHLDEDITVMVKTLPHFDQMCANVKRLDLWVRDKESLEHSNMLLKSTRNLKTLMINDSFGANGNKTDLNDRAAGAGRISKTLFQHLGPFNTIKQSARHNIRRLEVVNVALRYSANSYCKAINLEVLETLQVDHCTGEEAFLAVLCQAGSFPNALKNLWYNGEDNAMNDVLHALEDLLKLLSGIESLFIDVTYSKALPAVEAICRHKKTLTKLLIHAHESDHSAPDDTDTEYVYSLEDLRSIVSTCSELKTVSLAFPQSNFFELDPYYPCEYFSYWDTLLELPNLHAVHTLTWPGRLDGESTALHSHFTYSGIFHHLVTNPICQR